MKLLLHTCCAPCAIYPVSEARKDRFRVTGFFYNSNIQPHAEYVRRKNAAEEYFKSEELELVSAKYNIANFMGALHMETPMSFPRKRESKSLQKQGWMPAFAGMTVRREIPTASPRCAACWNMRLEETARFAKKNGFDAFTTTLLGSPYQEHDILKKICEKLSEEEKISFYYKDFRTGFRDAHKIAREKKMYCQNYCGCVFSMVEKEKKRTPHLRVGNDTTGVSL